MWLASSRMFWILGLGWVGCIAFYVTMSVRLGKVAHSQGDGCGLAFCNTLFVLVSGMGGYALVRYPYNIALSIALAFLVPAAITIGWIRRTNRSFRP